MLLSLMEFAVCLYVRIALVMHKIHLSLGIKVVCVLDTSLIWFNYFYLFIYLKKKKD